jgi:hypothetical protein
MSDETTKPKGTTSKSEARRIASLKAAEQDEAQVPVVEDTDDREEVVEVKKSDLAEFVRRLNTLEEDNKRLLAVADKGRLSVIEEKERQAQRSLPTVKITRMGSSSGKMVMAWRMTNNESYVDGNRMVERQTIEVFFQDGTSEVMPLINFYRQQNKDTTGRIVSRTHDQITDGEMLKVELPSGELLDIELKYVN